MENIDFELYRIFYYVAVNKNISKTAKVLLISQPAVTQSMKKLEEQLEYQLFYRTSRGIELTEEGEELFNNIKNAIECLNNCKKELHKQHNKENEIIKIGGGTTLLKHNALTSFKKFKEKYPNIKIDIEKGITKELIEKLDNNLIDLVLFNMPIELSENIIFETIEEVQDILVANSKIFKNIKNKIIDIDELSNLPFILQSEVSTSRKYFNNICKKNKIILNNNYDLQSYDLVLEFVKAGLGIGFINKNHIQKELIDKSLFEVKVNFKIPKRQIGIAFNKKNKNNKYLQEFIKIIKK